MTTRVTALTDLAQKAVALYPNSHIEAALWFGQQVPSLQKTNSGLSLLNNDRLVKIGRSLFSLLQLYTENHQNTVTIPPPIEGEDTTTTTNVTTPETILIDQASLELSLHNLVKECELLLQFELQQRCPTSASDRDMVLAKIPRVRFGKTGIQMPVITLGCMRFQQEWGPRITNMNMVGSDCQDNLVAILEAAIVQYGMVHIETARGYGSSELQIGTALKQLFQKGCVKREDLILQTKVRPFPNVTDFRNSLEASFRNLQVEYLDLFAFHGLNYEAQWEWVFGKDIPQNDGEETTIPTRVESCLDVVKEYQKAGKIRHIGFSTHAPTEMICRYIETGAFEYVNLHYHYFGSYTASGGGVDGHGNLSAVKMLHERDMGCFIISPFDKGGRLYEPSRKLRSLTLPDMEPMAFMCQWIWNHHKLTATSDSDGPPLHTFTLGAGRSSDLDQAVAAAHWFATQPDQCLTQTKAIVERLDRARIEALGRDWVETWWKGLPKSHQVKSLVEHNQIVWIYNNIKAFGLYEFGKARYGSFESNFAKWDPKLPPDQNIEKVGRDGWGFVPGLPLTPGEHYEDELQDVPPENKWRVVEAQEFVIRWCSKEQKTPEDDEKTSQWKERVERMRRSFSSSTQGFRIPRIPSITLPNVQMPNFLQKRSSENDLPEINKTKQSLLVSAKDQVPWEWHSSYDMRPWPDYPDQASRA